MTDQPEVHGGTPLFSSDTGALGLDTRLVLCKLFQGPYIEADSAHWTALLRDEAIVRTRLADVFLDLVVDRDRGVAFTRQADTGDLDTPVLLRSLPLTYLESVLVLFLREHLVNAESRNERAVVDEDLLSEALAVFIDPGKEARASQKKLGAAVEKMCKNKILIPIRGPERRMEISPVLRLLFAANDVEQLGLLYRKMAAGEPVTVQHKELDDEG